LYRLSIIDIWDDLDVAFDLPEAVTREGGKWILRASASGV
jgi:hypothetical protein